MEPAVVMYPVWNLNGAFQKCSEPLWLIQLSHTIPYPATLDPNKTHSLKTKRIKKDYSYSDAGFQSMMCFWPRSFKCFLKNTHKCENLNDLYSQGSVVSNNLLFKYVILYLTYENKYLQNMYVIKHNNKKNTQKPILSFNALRHHFKQQNGRQIVKQVNTGFHTHFSFFIPSWDIWVLKKK